MDISQCLQLAYVEIESKRPADEMTIRRTKDDTSQFDPDLLPVVSRCARFAISGGKCRDRAKGMVESGSVSAQGSVRRPQGGCECAVGMCGRVHLSIVQESSRS